MRQKIIANLGRLDELIASGTLEKISDALSRYVEKRELLCKAEELMATSALSFSPVPVFAAFGGETVYQEGVTPCYPNRFKFILDDNPADFAKDVFLLLLESNHIIKVYKTSESIKDIETPERLKRVVNDFNSGIPNRLNQRHRRKAVFLDRDGVINERVDDLRSLSDLYLLKDVGKAIRKINSSGLLAIVVTNQPVAKGYCSEGELEEIHRKMQMLLGIENAHVDEIYYCPHHSESGFAGEIAKLKKVCNCRKPETGLLLRAAHDLNVDLIESFMIGDSTTDVLTGINAGMITILLRTGNGGQDCKFQCEPDFIFETLDDAVNYILNSHKRLVHHCNIIASKLDRGKCTKPVVAIGGLSRSGKTALARVLSRTLMGRGLPSRILSLDNWLLDDREQRKKSISVRERYDYSRIERDFIALLQGQTVSVAKCDPITHVYSGKSEVLRLEKGEVLIVDGVVSLDCKLIRDSACVKIYTEVTEALRQERFWSYYGSQQVAPDDIGKLYDKRQIDETPVIVGSKNFATYVVPTDEQP